MHVTATTAIWSGAIEGFKRHGAVRQDGNGMLKTYLKNWIPQMILMYSNETVLLSKQLTSIRRYRHAPRPAHIHSGQSARSSVQPYFEQRNLCPFSYNVFEVIRSPSGGDWAVHRGGAVFVEGVNDSYSCTWSPCNDIHGIIIGLSLYSAFA